MIIVNQFIEDVVKHINETDKRIKEKRKRFEQKHNNGAMLTSHRFRVENE